MATTLTQNTEELKSLLQYLDKDLLNRAISLAKQRYSIILKTVDDLIAKHRSEGLDIEHCRRVYYLTCLGPVSVSRRIYSDKSGKRRCLLDELMGMGRRGHNTLTVKEYAVELPTKMPYRRAAEVLGKLTAIEMTHQTMHRMVKKLSASYLETQIQQRQQFEATGEIPHSKGKTPAQIMIEADGVMVSQQRQKERKIEVKLGIAYEGWKEVSRGRYATENKTVFAAIGGSDNFWTDMTLELQKNYDFPGIRNVIIGGDGAAWVREGANYMGGHFQLDRYHLQRELTTALGRDKEAKHKIWQAIEIGEPKTALSILKELCAQAHGDQQKKLDHACNYLRANINGVRDYRLDLGKDFPSLRRTGAIEGNVDKFVARRMKNQGMSWSVKGIRSLLCIRLLIYEGKLTRWLKSPSAIKQLVPPFRKVQRIVSKLSMQEPDDWLKAGIPALFGPHASRPWVNALRSLVETPTI